MSQFTFFPNMHWHNRALDFPENDLYSLPSSSWKVTRKLSENSDSYTQEEVKEAEEFPLACARFECENLEDPSKQAILVAYMGIPCEDTECAAEGMYLTPICVRVALKAHHLLTAHNCEYSPRLIQYMEATQTSEDRRHFMPGGKIYYLVIGKLPGVPLGNGLLHQTGDGRTYVGGLFWDLPRQERDQICTAFHNAYLEHVRSGATVGLKSLGTLHWDKVSGKIYVQATFEPLDMRDLGLPTCRQLAPYGPKVLQIWKLAIAPKGEVKYDVSIDDLDNLGWIL